MNDLERLAAQGRQELTSLRRKQAEEAARAASDVSAEEAAERRSALALRSPAVLRGISRLTDPTVFLGMFTPVVALLGLDIGFIPAGVMLALTCVMAGWVLLRRRRVRAISAALPFPVDGLGLGLGLPRSYPRCWIHVDFVRGAPDAAVLEQAFAALYRRRPLQRVTVEPTEDPDRVVLRIDSAEGSKNDGHRRWLVRWWCDAAQVVLPAVHRAHPIARLTFPI